MIERIGNKIEGGGKRKILSVKETERLIFKDSTQESFQFLRFPCK